MNIMLWIGQGLLFLVFTMTGFMKVTKTREFAIKKGMGYAEDLSDKIYRLIGALEILGAIGIIFPLLTGIMPLLTPLAAIGLALTMIGAALTHLRRNEYQLILANIALLALALFVALGRFGIF